MFMEDCLVKSNNMIVEGIYKMELTNRSIAQESKAGQFIQIKVNKLEVPLLRRPISINEIKVNEGTIVIYYKVVGKGTEIMTDIRAEEMINVIGPLGTGFDTDMKNKNIAVIGGGIGLAPLIELCKVLHNDNNIFSHLGFYDIPYLVDEFKEYSNNVEISTVTGKVGMKGFVTQGLEKALKDNNIDMIYACGPNIMLRAIKDIASNLGIKCQLSLEERMACGIGACLGCSVETTEGTMKKVCHDGPVFWSDEVKLYDEIV